MARRREVEKVLLELGAAQQGVVARAQLRQRGMSISAIDRLVRAGRVQVRHPGVYQIGPLPLPGAAERAAILALRGEGRVSHGTAARRHGLLEEAAHTNSVEVTMPHRRRRRLEGVRIHRVRDLRDDEVVQIDGISVTTPARTLLDLAECATARHVEQAYAAALRKQLVTPGDMREMLERHPTHRGAPLWRRLMVQHGGPAFTRSQAEEKLLALVRSAGLLLPELNAKVLGHEIDFLWRDARLIVEVDGYVFHSSRHSFGMDRRRDAELTAAGYRVLRLTWDDLTVHRLVTVARLAGALAR
jgi:very-short-patch-repair endonuclease